MHEHEGWSPCHPPRLLDLESAPPAAASEPRRTRGRDTEHHYSTRAHPVRESVSGSGVRARLHTTRRARVGDQTLLPLSDPVSSGAVGSVWRVKPYGHVLPDVLELKGEMSEGGIKAVCDGAARHALSFGYALRTCISERHRHQPPLPDPHSQIAPPLAGCSRCMRCRT